MILWYCNTNAIFELIKNHRLIPSRLNCNKKKQTNNSLKLLLLNSFEFQTMTHQNLFDHLVSHYVSFLMNILTITTLPTKNPKHPRKNENEKKTTARYGEGETESESERERMYNLVDADRDWGREIRNTFITICSSRLP